MDVGTRSSKAATVCLERAVLREQGDFHRWKLSRNQGYQSSAQVIPSTRDDPLGCLGFELLSLQLMTDLKQRSGEQDPIRHRRAALTQLLPSTVSPSPLLARAPSPDQRVTWYPLKAELPSSSYGSWACSPPRLVNSIRACISTVLETHRSTIGPCLVNLVVIS